MPATSLDGLRSASSLCAGTKPMRSDSMDRTGRVGDFQWRFFKGSFASMVGCTRGNKPDGSVYSTIWLLLVNKSVRCGVWDVVIPVTLLEAACEGSIVPESHLGNSQWHSEHSDPSTTNCCAPPSEKEKFTSRGGFSWKLPEDSYGHAQAASWHSKVQQSTSLGAHFIIPS